MDGLIEIRDGAILVAFFVIGPAAIVIGDGSVLHSFCEASRENARAAAYAQVLILILLTIAASASSARADAGPRSR